jgi:hypothetical protein
VAAQEYFFSKSFCKILVTNFWPWLSQEWVGDSRMQWNLKYLLGTWLRHWLNKASIWTTPAMDWVATDSQRSDLRAVPTKACFFNTSWNHFCCINVWGPGTTHCSQACQNRKSISVLGPHVTFFYKNSRPIFQTLQNRRNSGSRYFKSSRTVRFHQRTTGYLTFSNVFCGQWVMYQKNWVFGVFWESRLGAWRTAVISGSW